MPGASAGACAPASVARSLVAATCSRMRRSRMPVRSTIQASEVSTIFSRSALVSTSLGDAAAGADDSASHARHTSRGGRLGDGGRVVPQERVAARPPAVSSCAQARRWAKSTGHEDRVLDRLRVRAAVADQRHALDAEQRRAAGLGVVGAALEAPQAPAASAARPASRSSAAAHAPPRAPSGRPPRPAPRAPLSRRCR